MTKFKHTTYFSIIKPFRTVIFGYFSFIIFKCFEKILPFTEKSHFLTVNTRHCHASRFCLPRFPARIYNVYTFTALSGSRLSSVCLLRLSSADPEDIIIPSRRKAVRKIDPLAAFSLRQRKECLHMAAGNILLPSRCPRDHPVRKLLPEHPGKGFHL